MKAQLGDMLPEHPRIHLDSAYNEQAMHEDLEQASHGCIGRITAKGIKGPNPKPEAALTIW